MISGSILIVTLVVVFLTSALSGILGMGGGMILMAVLAGLLPVTTAMVIHGIVQAVANGSRFIILIRHVAWRVLPTYGLGVGAGLGLFCCAFFSTEKWLIYLIMGSLPFVPKQILTKVAPDILRPVHSFACGFFVTMMQMLAGASGPLLDMFFQETKLTRQEIIATKAVTQTSAHIIKASYYAALVGSAQLISTDLLMLMVVATIGTWVGTRLLERMDEQRFRFCLKLGIRIIGFGCVVKGVSGLVAYAGQL